MSQKKNNDKGREYLLLGILLFLLPSGLRIIGSLGDLIDALVKSFAVVGVVLIVVGIVQLNRNKS